jgi:hypothetical protein
MRTTRIGNGAVALALALAVSAGAAWAGNPNPELRRESTIAAFGQVQVCQGPPNDGAVCIDDAECDTPGNTGAPTGACSGTRGARLLVRGTLTVIADTVLASPPPADPFLETAPTTPCTTCEGEPGRSSFTLLLQFARDGKRFTFAETYTNVQNDGVDGFGSQVPGEFIANWSFGAFESTLVNSGETFPDYKIGFALLPPAAATAVAAALGEPEKVPVVLEVLELAECTDSAACNHCVASGSEDCIVDNDEWSKHSGPSDPLASVRQFKVGIGFIDPPAP